MEKQLPRIRTDPVEKYPSTDYFGNPLPPGLGETYLKHQAEIITTLEILSSHTIRITYSGLDILPFHNLTVSTDTDWIPAQEWCPVTLAYPIPILGFDLNPDRKRNHGVPVVLYLSSELSEWNPNSIQNFSQRILYSTWNCIPKYDEVTSEFKPVDININFWYPINAIKMPHISGIAGYEGSSINKIIARLLGYSLKATINGVIASTRRVVALRGTFNQFYRGSEKRFGELIEKLTQVSSRVGNFLVLPYAEEIKVILVIQEKAPKPSLLTPDKFCYLCARIDAKMELFGPELRVYDSNDFTAYRKGYIEHIHPVYIWKP